MMAMIGVYADWNGFSGPNESVFCIMPHNTVRSSTEPFEVSIAGYFRLNLAEADEIIHNFIDIVSQWRTIANGLQLPQREQEYMAEAFRLAVN